MRDFFKNKLGYFPYDYQVKVMEVLLLGKNIILSVPTGAGKTWASVIPFLYAMANPDVHFPKKMIYSLPLRALANSIFEDVSKIVDGTSIQTGEYSKDIVFSTIDQTLSNFLCFPLPLSQRQANINAGALIGSYLVFDEFHLLDEKLSMATTIGMLDMLGNLCRCCIMTATLSEGFMKALKGKLENYEIITLDDFPGDKAIIGSLKPEIKKKKIQVIDDKISVANIIKKHKTKTIVICNRVETTQEIYNQLATHKKNSNDDDAIENTQLICLHSRFFDYDRKEKEKQLKSLFGKDANDQSVILISTQVIEAGMDISCEVMHTEISPISSFLQRAGRCARFSNQTGKIFIYDVLEPTEKEKILIEAESKEDKVEIRKLNNKYLPYDATLTQKTFKELKKHETLGGNIPNQLIESILGNEEQQIISSMQAGQGGGFNKDKIRESWRTCQKNNYRNTIRDIQSVEITLMSHEMENEICKYPYRYQSLGMYKWSLVGWVNRISQSENYDPEDWLVKALEESTIIGNDEDDNYQLTKITDFKTIPAQVYVNAKYFGYHPDFGFNWQYADTFGYISPKKEYKQKEDEFKALSKDTFYQHNMGLVRAFEKEFLGANSSKLDFIFKELGRFIQMPELHKDDFVRAIYLMIVLHDYGKLNTNWQSPMQQYQALKENISTSYPAILAHTDYDGNNVNDQQIANQVALHKRPAHAGVGAMVAQEILPELFSENDYLKSSISMAIAKHHSPYSVTYPKFAISDENYQAINVLLEQFSFGIALKKKGYEGKIEGFETDWYGEQILYLFFVRILRLCDQKATENLKKYFND
ncbi:MAG TPA: CRISPR-associated helicase Cas3' [Niabella sp.]|nr:CRISPR-associated helicase Cas3' [Niabella sp.]